MIPIYLKRTKDCQEKYDRIIQTISYMRVLQYMKTSQELRMLSSVTINCQTTKIVMNSGSQLSEL